MTRFSDRRRRRAVMTSNKAGAGVAQAPAGHAAISS
jgi:hypothetical protein